MTRTKFYEQIKEGPIFLLLGQNYLRIESGTDQFLSIALRKFNCPNSEPQHYDQLLQGKAYEDVEAALGWMEERCVHLPAPEWLATVAQLPWNGIYTSAIDIIWPPSFENEWRRIDPVVDEKYKPISPRDPSSLLCTFLFGKVSGSEEFERPPLNQRELRRRNMVATGLIKRLPDIVTPFGTLIIEGYAGSLDWLKLDVLTATLDGLNSRPTHIFSVTGTLAEEFEDNEDIQALVKEGKLILHAERLATCILEGIHEKLLHIEESMPKVAEGRRISLENGPVIVPADLWRQVSRTATILDDTITLSEAKYSEEKEYADFRTFLGGSNQKAVWSGYKRGFAFSRDYEKQLYNKVIGLLKAKKTPSNPIIVHGQTGTGKTVALRALAYKIRQEKKHLVLFIDRRTQGEVNHFAIERFCKWADENKAPACLIIWDGMVEIEQYTDLLTYLVGRGRKVVVVGSCYRLTRKIKAHDLIFEAPNRLQESTELPRFNEFLKKFNVTVYQVGNLHLKKKPDDTFLVTLYHLLPDTKPRIRMGILDEFYNAEQRLSEYVKERKLDPVYDTVLAYKLFEAGLIELEKLTLSNEEKEFSHEDLTEIKKLTGLVMVPGSLGLKVPLELLLHTLDKLGQENFIDILRQSDIIQCVLDDVGNYVVTPRHPLEAQIFMLNRIGGPSYEVEYIQKLLAEINDNGGISNNPEVQFAVDLLRRLRPDEQTAKSNRYTAGRRYVDYFHQLAKTLEELRTKRSIINPRLMLQEATLLREYVINQDMKKKNLADGNEANNGNIPPENTEGSTVALQMLDKAEDIVRDALDMVQADTQNAKFRSRLYVELASILGTRMKTLLREVEFDPEDALELFKDIRRQVLVARALDAENFYPIDVLSWVTTAIFTKGLLSEQEQLEAEADIFHIFEMADTEDFDFHQLERFHRRRVEIAQMLKKQEITQDALDRLQKMGSCAGYYLKAFFMAGYQPGELVNTVLSEDRILLCKQAVAYLEENRHAIRQDGRCLFLLLRLWWMSHTKFPIFYHEERQILPFSQNQWLYCLDLLNDLRRAGSEDEYNTPPINYLRGLAAFHLEQTEEAFTIFKEVEQEAETMQGKGRIRYNYLASAGPNSPINYRGTIRWLDKDWDRSQVYVERLRRIIPFFPREFGNQGNQEIREGGPLEFHIAFNFLGPIAVSRQRPGRTDEIRES